MNELEDLRERSKDLIINTCNKVGCGNCGLGWEEDGEKTCQSAWLENKIHDIELSN